MADELTIEESTQSLYDDDRRYGDRPARKGKLLRPIADVDDPNTEEIDWAAHQAVAKHAAKHWDATERHFERELEQWRVNAARRQGVTSARLVRDPDDHWTARFPSNPSPDVIPSGNKAARLCRRFLGHMFADPPAPIVEPPEGDNPDEDAAEFSTRALVDLQGESNLNTIEKMKDAFDLASTFDSGFVRYYVDPRGGGRVPIQVRAGHDPETGLKASHMKEALRRPVMEPVTMVEYGVPQPVPSPENPDQPLMRPVIGPDGQPVEEEWPAYEERYVQQDGVLTDDEAQAARRWAPAIRSEALDGRNVRPIPHTATDVWDAKAMQVAVMMTYGEAKDLYPKIGTLSKEECERLFGYKPKKADRIFPDVDWSSDNSKGIKDNRPLFVLTTYWEMNEADGYPEGLYLVTIGDSFVAERAPWSAVNRVTKQREKLLIPISQVNQWRGGHAKFFRQGTMTLVGGGNELRAAQLAALLDHLDRIARRKTFIPTNSIVSPQQLQLPTGTAIPINPGGKPEYEDIPAFPKEALEMYALASQEMDEDSGLLETAEAGTQAESGRHLYGIIAQVQVGLSDPKQFVERAYIRCCRIELQLARAFLTTPQQLKWKEDGRYQHRAWTGADLLDTTDIRVKPGTMTMLSPAAKAQFTEHLYAEMQLITAAEAREMITTNVGGLIGLQDDEYRMRIRRQLAEWGEGPPEGWTPPPPTLATVDPATGQPMPVPPQQAQAAQAAGLPLQEVPTPDPVLLEIWDPLPADELPEVAAMRLEELGRFMSTSRFSNHPPEWQRGVLEEFARMQMAAMPPMPLAPPEGGGGSAEPGPEGVPAEAGAEGVPPDMTGGMMG